jgi:hypothetical protein
MLPVGFEERLRETLYKVKMRPQDFKKALNITAKVATARLEGAKILASHAQSKADREAWTRQTTWQPKVRISASFNCWLTQFLLRQSVINLAALRNRVLSWLCLVTQRSSPRRYRLHVLSVDKSEEYLLLRVLLQ